MQNVKKTEVIQVLHQLLHVSKKELETWTAQELTEGIRKAHELHCK